MSTKDQPANNVFDFPQRHRAGQQRVMRVSNNSFLVADNSPFGGFQNLSNQPEGFDKAHRSQLAEAHIELFEQKLRLENPNITRLDDETRRKIISIAQDPANKSPETVVQAVIIATSQAMPAPSAALDNFLKHHNISKEEYFTALGKVGAGLNPEQVLAAYRALKAKEAMGLAADGIAYNSNNSTGFPGYGGRVLNTETDVHNYANANYGISLPVSRGLHELGVRSTEQVKQVMSDVGRIGLGVGKDNPVFTNRVAVDVAKIRKLEGERTPDHMDAVKKDAEEHARISLAIKQAEANGDTKGAEALKAQLAQHHKKLDAYIGTKVQNPEARPAVARTAKAAREEAVRQQNELIKKHGIDAVIAAGAPKPNSQDITAIKEREQVTAKKSDADADADLLAAAGPVKKTAEVVDTKVEPAAVIADKGPDKAKHAGTTVVADAGSDKAPAATDTKAKDTAKTPPAVVAQNTAAKPAAPKIT